MPAAALAPLHGRVAHVLALHSTLDVFLHAHGAVVDTAESVLSATIHLPVAGRYVLQLEHAVAATAVELCVAEASRHLHRTPYAEGWLAEYDAAETFAVFSEAFELQVEAESGQEDAVNVTAPASLPLPPPRVPTVAACEGDQSKPAVDLRPWRRAAPSAPNTALQLAASEGTCCAAEAEAFGSSNASASTAACAMVALNALQLSSVTRGSTKRLEARELNLAGGEWPPSGACMLLRLSASDAATGAPLSDLEPYLEAQAHVVVASEGLPAGERLGHAHAAPALAWGSLQGRVRGYYRDEIGALRFFADTLVAQCDAYATVPSAAGAPSTLAQELLMDSAPSRFGPNVWIMVRVPEAAAVGGGAAAHGHTALLASLQRRGEVLTAAFNLPASANGTCDSRAGACSAEDTGPVRWVPPSLPPPAPAAAEIGAGGEQQTQSQQDAPPPPRRGDAETWDLEPPWWPRAPPSPAEGQRRAPVAAIAGGVAAGAAVLSAAIVASLYRFFRREVASRAYGPQVDDAPAVASNAVVDPPSAPAASVAADAL